MKKFELEVDDKFMGMISKAFSTSNHPFAKKAKIDTKNKTIEIPKQHSKGNDPFDFIDTVVDFPNMTSFTVKGKSIQITEMLLNTVAEKRYSDFETRIQEKLNKDALDLLEKYKTFCQEEIFEEMSPEEIQKSEEKAKELFRKEMQKKFPEHLVNVRKAPLGGGIVFAFANISKKDSKDNISFLNAPFKFSAIMHLTDGGGNRVPMSKFSIEVLTMGRGFKKNGIKFRKITGKSPEDAVKKLLKWFDKAKSTINEPLQEEKLKETGETD